MYDLNKIRIFNIFSIICLLIKLYLKLIKKINLKLIGNLKNSVIIHRF